MVYGLFCSFELCHICIGKAFSLLVFWILIFECLIFDIKVRNKKCFLISLVTWISATYLQIYVSFANLHNSAKKYNRNKILLATKRRNKMNDTPCGLIMEIHLQNLRACLAALSPRTLAKEYYLVIYSAVCVMSQLYCQQLA